MDFKTYGLEVKIKGVVMKACNTYAYSNYVSFKTLVNSAYKNGRYGGWGGKVKSQDDIARIFCKKL